MLLLGHRNPHLAPACWWNKNSISSLKPGLLIFLCKGWSAAIICKLERGTFIDFKSMLKPSELMHNEHPFFQVVVIVAQCSMRHTLVKQQWKQQAMVGLKREVKFLPFKSKREKWGPLSTTAQGSSTLWAAPVLLGALKLFLSTAAFPFAALLGRWCPHLRTEVGSYTKFHSLREISYMPVFNIAFQKYFKLIFIYKDLYIFYMLCISS